MARKIVKLAILLIFANALYRFIPVYFHYQQFKDAVHEAALFARGRTDAQLIDHVMDLAAKYQIPLEREYVQVRHDNERTIIDASYIETIEWFPTYKRTWQFDVGEQAFANVRPTKPGDVGR